VTRIRAIPYLFSEPGLVALCGFVDHTTLFAFDLDGTLAPIAAHPQSILVSEAATEALGSLISHASVAIITGRSRSDAEAHLRVAPRFIAGNHGAEGLPGWEAREGEFRSLCVDWERQLSQIFLQTDHSGITIENKGTTLSIHYRAARNRKKAQSLILQGIDRLLPRPRRVSGKCVENLLPEGAPDKGRAMLYLMELAKRPKAFYVGDDVTDEEVFRMDGDHFFTVRVGTTGVSRAQYALRNQGEIVRLLREINRALERPP
jgi:trehalose 6-phosphate phosphatase